MLNQTWMKCWLEIPVSFVKARLLLTSWLHLCLVQCSWKRKRLFVFGQQEDPSFSQLGSAEKRFKLGFSDLGCLEAVCEALLHRRVDLMLEFTFLLEDIRVLLCWNREMEADPEGSFILAFFSFYTVKLSSKIFVLAKIPHVTFLERLKLTTYFYRHVFSLQGSLLCPQLITSLALTWFLNKKLAFLYVYDTLHVWCHCA